MEPTQIKLEKSDAQYRGSFHAPQFALLAQPIPLYTAMMKHLGVFGAKLDSLRFDASVLADASVTCALPDVATIIRVRLDRLEIECTALHEARSVASRLLDATWTSIHEASPDAAIMAHLLVVNIFGIIEGEKYDTLITRFVTIPPELQPRARAAVSYTWQPEASSDEFWRSIVLEKVDASPTGIHLRFSLAFNGASVPVSQIAERAERSVIESLTKLGLAIP